MKKYNFYLILFYILLSTIILVSKNFYLTVSSILLFGFILLLFIIKNNNNIIEMDEENKQKIEIERSKEKQKTKINIAIELLNDIDYIQIIEQKNNKLKLSINELIKYQESLKETKTIIENLLEIIDEEKNFINININQKNLKKKIKIILEKIQKIENEINNNKLNKNDIIKSINILFIFIEKFIKALNLTKIGTINEKIIFNPKEHNSDDNLIPYQKAILIQYGWKLGNQIIKKPFVRGENEF